MVAGEEINGSSADEVRIGVFVCDCGTNIGGVINVPEVVEFAKTLEGVVFADEGKWICAVDYLSKIKEYISEYKLTRVVVACCTPRTHEPTFKSTLKEAGLNPFLLEFVSIREQSSWVHKETPELATEKAKDLVRMGVAKARFLEPGIELRIPVGKECLIIGGGIAGMTSALALGDLGFKVLLIEKSNGLGGLLNKLYKIAPSDSTASEIIEPKIKRILEHGNINVKLNCEVTEIKGYVGNFTVKLKIKSKPEDPTLDSEHEHEHEYLDVTTEEHSVSTIIVATGMTEVEPVGQFGYGNYQNVVTQLQFEELLKSGEEKLADIKDIAFINCVNSRNSEHGCCNVGCMASIKNIKTVKELNDEINSYLFFRDFNVTGFDVQYHYNSMQKYSAAFRYPDNSPPFIEEKVEEIKSELKDDQKPRLTIQCYDILTGGEVKIEADLVVLATGYAGDSSVDALKGMLKVSTNHEGFFLEAHVKLRPLDFANEGIYVCGCARSPKDIRATLEESIGAAMRAAVPMNKSFVETEGIVANIEPEDCISCGICTDTCAFGAVVLIEKQSQVIQAICKGCGTCVASCPTETISIVHYSDEQIMAQVEAALSEHPEDKLIGFACHWCALGAVDNAGVSRFEYPPNIRIIRVMCSGRIDPRFVLRAFEAGAAGVLIMGCEFPTCHYIFGNYYASKKVQFIKRLLELVGINPNRLRHEWLSAAHGSKFATVVTEYTNTLAELGPIANDNYSSQNLQAAMACADEQRLRILITKLKEFGEFGNKYDELFSEFELERLMNDMVYDEFISKKILQSIRETGKSVLELSSELSVPSNRIFKNILDLQQAGRIQMDKFKGKSPLYISVSQNDIEKINDGSTPDTSKVSDEQITSTQDNITSKNIQTILNEDSAIRKSDFVVTGTTVDALNKAIELANSGKHGYLIADDVSFIPTPSVIAKGFVDYSKYFNDYCDLIEQIHKHKNIIVIRNTRINRIIKQNSGNEISSEIQLELHKRSTYINESKCDNCGLCLEACPVNLIDLDTYGLSNKHAIFHPLPKTPSIKYSISKGVPYCQASCPIMMDVRGYIGKLADGDVKGACEIMRRTNPLPDICGKVCDHACETTCARSYIDDPLEIRKLKRYAMETQYEDYEKINKPIITKPTIFKNHDSENKVAIIGSGPAGLAAAHDLARLGYPVTIFEGLSQPGGMLRVGIPNYRLPENALQMEIDAILKLGVELKLNTPLGPELSIEDLKSQGYKAIFVAIGAHKSLKLNISGEDLEGVLSGVELLRKYNLEKSIDSLKIGNRVAVIGGGNVALDCARSAKRLGAENVNILYRRTKNEMPSTEEELAQCEDEGISIDYLVMPIRIMGEAGKVRGVECQRTELGEPDASGRRRPIPIPGSEFTIEVDTVLTAIGQIPELGFLKGDTDFEFSSKLTFIIDNRTGRTNIDGVFAGGDAVTGPLTVIQAIKTGKTAARGIDEYLSGNLENNTNIYEFTGEKRISPMELLRYKKNYLTQQPEQKQKRKAEKLIDVKQRITNFDEVEMTLLKEDAIEEAMRCLSCRMCIGCGVCESVCPQDAIDYSMPDEYFTLKTKELLHYPKLTEGNFHNNYNLKKLYNDSLNVLTPMELEYMLTPKTAYNGILMRPTDGVIPGSIGFINLAENEYITEEQRKFNNLEFEFILRLIKLIEKEQPQIDIKLITNTKKSGVLPAEFEYLNNERIKIEEFKNNIIMVHDNNLKILENPKNKNIEIECNGKKYDFELVIVGVGLNIDLQN